MRSRAWITHTAEHRYVKHLENFLKIDFQVLLKQAALLCLETATCYVAHRRAEMRFASSRQGCCSIIGSVENCAQKLTFRLIPDREKPLLNLVIPAP